MNEDLNYIVPYFSYAHRNRADLQYCGFATSSPKEYKKMAASVKESTVLTYCCCQLKMAFETVKSSAE